MIPRTRIVAMSNSPDVPSLQGRHDEATVDAAVQNVEHQISLFWRRARSISNQLSRQVHPDMEPAAYGLLTVIRREGPIRLTDLAMNIGARRGRQVAENALKPPAAAGGFSALRSGSRLSAGPYRAPERRPVDSSSLSSVLRSRSRSRP